MLNTANLGLVFISVLVLFVIVHEIISSHPLIMTDIKLASYSGSLAYECALKNG
jgi:hypothetical protein